MRIRIIKTYAGYGPGAILNMSTKQAKLLIKKGIALISKDMTAYDLKVK